MAWVIVRILFTKEQLLFTVQIKYRLLDSMKLLSLFKEAENEGGQNIKTHSLGILYQEYKLKLSKVEKEQELLLPMGASSEPSSLWRVARREDDECHR